MNIFLTIFLWSLVAIIFIWQVVLRIVRKIKPFPIPQFMTSIIDNPFRRKFIQNPDRIAERMGAKHGMIVLEIGPGKGSYTIGVAKKIGTDGKIYSIDIEPKIINRLKNRIKEENHSNIYPKVDDAYNLSFEKNTFDLIFEVSCLPEIPQPVKVLTEFKRVLKPCGIVSLCELFLDPDYPLRSTEKKWAKQAGLKFKNEFGNWFSYQLNFTK